MKTHNKSAVEWIKKQLEGYGSPSSLDLDWETLDNIIEQAKEKEKDQIKEAYTDGIKISNAYMDSSDYYEQNYKSEVNE